MELVQFNFRMPRRLRERLEAIAERKGMPFSVFARVALTERCEDEERRQQKLGAA